MGNRFWQTVIPRHRGQTLLVVSHGDANRALISTSLGLSPSRYHQLQQSNCGISVLNFSADWNSFAHAAQLEMMNSTTHLGETLPKLKEGEDYGCCCYLTGTAIQIRQPSKSLACYNPRQLILASAAIHQAVKL